MGRLIDRDELLTAFPVDDEPMLTKSCVRMTIRRMPTVDAVPVVRCKDCRYWDISPASTAAPAYHECKARASRLGRIHTTEEEYCSRGERKDGDGNGGIL